MITGGTPDSDPDGDSLTVTSITAPTVTETDAQLSITSITSQSAGSGEIARYQILTNTGTALLAVTSGGDVRPGDGTIAVAFTANGSATDQLTFQNQGVGAKIVDSASNVTFGGTTIGTFSGGTNRSQPRGG